jgi:hypothetical protein
MKLARWLGHLAICMLLTGHSTARADPQISYLLYCGGCHLQDGTGTPPEVPSLHDDLGRIVQLKGGREYIVRVPGASQAPVSNRELAEILNWILHTFNAATITPGFSPLTESEVAASRDNVLADPLKYRAELWRNYEAGD